MLNISSSVFSHQDVQCTVKHIVKPIFNTYRQEIILSLNESSVRHKLRH